MKKLVSHVHFEHTYGTAPTKTRSMKAAQIISRVANPLVVALPTFLLIALHTAPDTAHALLWWSVTALGMTAAPFLFILQGVYHGHYTDRDLSVREQRFVPLLFGLLCTSLAFTILVLLHASRLLLAIMIAIFVSGTIAFIITRYWKISFHLIGISGSVTACILIFGPLASLLFPLVVLVGWARWHLGAHTIPQILAGIALAIAATIGTFGLLGVH